MDENEKKEFKDDIVKQVSEIVGVQHRSNRDNWKQFNSDLGERLTKTIPAILGPFAPKNNYWFSALMAILNGVAVGVSVYVAMRLA